ncbi:ATP-binding protein [Engelhardtia mirabilis]|uniref:histidine kinase n=1 Tax=Engelhardtia mirabilis TaxID=2528011 RepID=A0A518BMD3_9BACT|nr:Sensor protein ZraS [Planctomycetes bacterium Pla133]QDV02466.1 Sensor protein ZraS [Planctomycetes bacterium Pla86]
MFLLEIVDLMALVGLLVQAFTAWVFVAVLASLQVDRRANGAYRAFLQAFVVLSVALTLMSVRFFRAHDTQTSYDLWADGALLPTLCYMAYMGLKAAFGLLLVRGSSRLVGVDRSPRHPWAPWGLVLAYSATPIVVSNIDLLLALQAPMMIACSAVALRLLSPSRGSGTGTRLLCWSFIGLIVSWAVHATSALTTQFGDTDLLRPLLSLNSFTDLGVQMILGVGLVVGLLESSHQEFLRSEQERQRLARALARDERLRALGTAVSGVAHELNNPLTVISGYSELLLLDDPNDRRAVLIHEQAARCRGIVRNLSTLAGQSLHPTQAVEVDELLERVLRGLPDGETTGGRSVRVEPLSHLWIAADPLGIEQVLSNLIVNALHASPPGGTVSVGGRATDQGIELTVSDQGSGVDSHLRERIFEPFFTTKSPGKGTGLGLSIVHAIVRGHGGSISVEQAPEGGARFRLLLPRADPRPTELTPAARPRSTAGRPLLIVDDDDAVRTILREHGEARGWRVREANTAEAALGQDLVGVAAVVCDLRMPGMGGAGFHDRLAASQPAVLARVVFVTGDMASTESTAFAARCEQPLFEKPFDYEELFEQLESIASSTAKTRA